MKWPLFLALFVCFWSFLGRADTRLESVRSPALRIRHWTREDGLPQAAAFSIAQTADDYIWLATYGGLARFDGRRFVMLGEEEGNPLRELSKTALLVSHTGEVLVPNRNGNIYAVSRNRWREVYTFPGLKIERLVEDHLGDLWMITTERSLIRARDQLTILLNADIKHTWSMLSSYHEAKSKRTWILRDRELGYIENGTYILLPKERQSAVRGLGPARDGGIWVVYVDRLERWVEGNVVESFATEPWVGSDDLSSVTETSDGRVALGSNTFGLFIFDRNGQMTHFDRTNGLADDWVTDLLVDREGSLWVGLGGNGLNALQRVTFQALGPSDGWRGRSLTDAVLDPHGDIWVGTEGASLYHYREGKWEQAALSTPNYYIWTIGFDQSGSLWMGSWGGGVFSYADGRFVTHPEIEDVYQSPAAFLNTATGGFWAASEKGLFRIEGSHIELFPLWDKKGGVMVKCMTQGKDGTIWLGTDGKGLAAFKDGKFRFWTKAEGLIDNHIRSLHVDDLGWLWVGNEASGLNVLLEDKLVRLNAEEGFVHRSVNSILDDGRGSFWFSTRDGIVCTSKDALYKKLSGSPERIITRTFTSNDGLPSTECVGSSCQLRDGTLVFSTKGGLALTRPELIVSNTVAPPIVIETLDIGTQTELLTDTTAITVTPGAERYTFHFTGPSFIASDNAVFTYKLQGVDKDWVMAGPERSATYSFLPPGKYIFSVRGANGNGVWNPQATSIGLTVPPFYWQTWWFKSLVVVGGASLLGSIAAWITQRKWARELEVLQRKQELERERARIARDIHDDLGANLTRISLLTQSAQRELVGSSVDEAAAHIGNISRTAREMTKTMDEIVWAVNPIHDSLDGVATYVAAYSQDFLGMADISCRWNFPLDLPNWPIRAEVRHNLFLAIKEALNNVTKHSKATRVDLALATFDDRFEITVSDNGLGFEVGQVVITPRDACGGNGLSNMNARLAEIGGQCDVSSSASKGTSIKFSIPVRAGAVASEKSSFL